MDNPYRSDFPIFQKHPRLAYLDNAATTQRPHHVIDTITKFYSEENANIHRGIYDLSNQATRRYEDVRKAAADLLKSKSDSCIGFTKGTTEAINIVARSYIQPQLQAGDNIITTTLEHHANFLPWQVICKENKGELRIIEVDTNGDLLLDQIKNLIDGRTKLIALNHISNTLGTINQIEEVIYLAHQKGVPVLIDAAQSAAYYELNSATLDYDFLAFSGHKIFGPFGTGILYVKEDFHEQMRPYNYGGGMIRDVALDDSSFATFPKNLEAGTANIADIIGLGSAIAYVNGLDKKLVRDHLAELTMYAESKLLQLPEVRLAGKPTNRSGIISFNLEDIHPHDVASFLNKDDIAVRAGMHCTQPLLKHLNLSATVRISFSIYNTKEEVDRLSDSLVSLLKFWNE